MFETQLLGILLPSSRLSCLEEDLSLLLLLLFILHLVQLLKELRGHQSSARDCHPPANRWRWYSINSEVGPGSVAAHCSGGLLAEAESWQVGLLGTTTLQLGGLEEAGAEGGWSWS